VSVPEQSKTVTVVTPVFNEGRALYGNVQAILGHLTSIGSVRMRVLIVDDGSTDDTHAVAERLCRERPEVSLLTFNRNFGKEAAIDAGLDHVEADAVIVMDSDLQHPPELIPQMVALWRTGIELVEGYKVSRGPESALSRASASGFYLLFSTLAGLDLRNQSDYKLLDRKVVLAYRDLPERRRFFRGLIAWMAFPSARIPYEVSERTDGTSRWSRWRLLRYSIDAVTAFSSAPLHLVTLLGAVTFFISLVFGTIALYQKLTGQAVGGFTTVILLLLIIGSILMVSLGLVGTYIARIYEEIKRRPTYVIDWNRSRVQG
jgi:polyisoprenyl-phosphate glycosyltransferase